MEYRHPGSPSVKKFRTLMPAIKVMLTIFRDVSGVPYTEFLTKGLTVNSDRERYPATLRSLKHIILRIRSEGNVSLLHQENARPHCCAQIEYVIRKLKFTVVSQLSYSPNLPSSDFWFLSKIEGDVERSMFFNGCLSSSSSAQMDKLKTRIFFHGRNEETDRTIEQMCSPSATIDLLKDTLGDRLISRFGPANWPPRSCDLTPLDYFLWGYVKSLVYADKPQTLDHLEDNIRRVIADIRPQMFEKVIENWTSRLDYIRASRGSHMPEIIFKM
ncbi:DUF4817 domain-containing protein [Trichonephila clavipes]|nr:DUF4817 domain-containing protein [Trichonephila clavipes]